MKSDIQFTPVTAGRASENVALEVETAIPDNKIKPGEHLPSERELKVQFGTGRGYHGSPSNSQAKKSYGNKKGLKRRCLC